jgi:hypothetical protein
MIIVSTLKDLPTMDDADLTDRRAEFEELQLAKVRAAQSIATLEYKECRQCEEALTEARQRGGFCSAECRDDFEWAQAATRRIGKPKA